MLLSDLAAWKMANSHIWCIGFAELLGQLMTKLFNLPGKSKFGYKYVYIRQNWCVPFVDWLTSFNWSMARFLCHSSMQRRKTLLEMTLFVKFLCINPTWKFWYWWKRITALGTRAINLLLDDTFKVCWFSSFIAKFDSTCAALMLTALLSCDNSEISRGKPPHSRIVFCEYKQSSLLWHFMTRLYYRWVTAYFTEINIALLNWRVFDLCLLRDGWWKGGE